MTKKAIIPIFFAFISCFNEKGKDFQNANTFIRLLNSGYNDIAQDICQTEDKGVIILATTEIEQNDTIRYKIKLIKLNEYGHQQWKKSYPAYGSSIDSVSYKGRAIMIDKDKSGNETGYFIIGDSIQKGVKSNSSIRIMITDKKGNIQKTRNIDGTQYGGLKGIAGTMNDVGNYVVLGSLDNPQGSNDLLLTELNTNLETVWQKTYGAGRTSPINRIFKDPLSPALIWAGAVLRNGIENARLVKSPPNSQTPIFDLPIGNNVIIKDFCIYGFNFAFIGSTKPANNSDIFVAIRGQGGNEIFSQTYGKSDRPEKGLAISTTKDGGLILLGTTEKTAGIRENVTDFYLVKLDPVGKVEWEQIIGGRNNQSGIRILEMSDGFLILGETSFGGLRTILVVKVDKHGRINIPS